MKKLRIIWWNIKSTAALKLYCVLSFIGLCQGDFGRYAVSVLVRLEVEDPR